MDYDQLYAKAEILYMKRKYKEALKFFVRANGINRTNDCQNYIGCCLLALNDLSSAESVFEELVANNPFWERPVFNLARVHLKFGNYKDALKLLQKAEQMNPSNEDVYYYYGVYYYNLKNYDVAKKYYEKSLSINNNQAETHLNLGMCFWKIEQYGNALNEFDISYTLDHECVESIYNQGLVYEELGRFNEAIEKLEYLNSINNMNTDYIKELANCYYRVKDYKKAIEWNNKALLIQPQNNEYRTASEKLSKLCNDKQ